jgi:adenosylhomocysteine nucleosidase
VSANVEWRALLELLAPAQVNKTPFGESFAYDFTLPDSPEGIPLTFFHGGWGKIAAAASTQYVISTCSPDLIINIGTCGGFQGEIERGVILLVDRTLVYDIIEQMGDFDEHIAHYTTSIDYSWLGDMVLPSGYRSGFLVSGDRDLVVEDLAWLKTRFGAYAGDWESAAIAWVARLNSTPVLILRGVTDLVGPAGGEAYGNIAVFQANTRKIMAKLVADLPFWLQHSVSGLKNKHSD